MRSLTRLTQREYEVLRYVAQGHSNRQIARQLVVSVATVQNHIHSILAKLDATNRTMAVAIAHRRGLLSIDKIDDRNQAASAENQYPGITTAW